MTAFFQTQLDRNPELMRSGILIDGGMSSEDRAMQREVGRNTVIVDDPPARHPFTGIVIAAWPGSDELQDTRYLVLQWRENGNRVFGRGWVGSYQADGTWHAKPDGQICPRHESAFRAVWYSERFVRFINTSEEA